MSGVRWAAPTALTLIMAFWFGAEAAFLAYGRCLRWRERRRGFAASSIQPFTGVGLSIVIDNQSRERAS